MSKILKDNLTFGRRQAGEPCAGQSTAQWRAATGKFR